MKKIPREVIELLKENNKYFGDLPLKIQKVFEQVGKENCVYLDCIHGWVATESTIRFYPDIAYRIKRITSCQKPPPNFVITTPSALFPPAPPVTRTRISLILKVSFRQSPLLSTPDICTNTAYSRMAKCGTATTGRKESLKRNL